MSALHTLRASVLVGALLAYLAAAAAAITTVPPREHGRLAGIAVGVASRGATRLPRRALDCTPLASPSPGESCRASLDGRELRVDVVHGDPGSSGFRDCLATYGAATAPCRAATFVCCGVSPVYAAIPVGALGIRDEVLQATRRQHPLDQLDEAGWLLLSRGLALLLGAGVALALLPAGGRQSRRLVAAPLAGLVVSVAAALAALAYLVASGRVD